MTGSTDRVLVVAGLGVWVDGTSKIGKIETHVYPLADAADHVTFVCTGPTAARDRGITYHQISPSRWKLLTLARQFLATLRLARAGDYDLIASFALLPYGLFALLAGALSRTPTHLGIIGGDLDVHAGAWYGTAVAWAFRRFDAVTVAGADYRDRLAALGVPRERIFTVLHPVGETFATRWPHPDPDYDVLWLTRMSTEKDPLLAVDALAILDDRGVDVSAALVGSGPLEDEVREAVAAAGLQDRVDVPGWTDEPVRYYRNARTYLLTSEREMLPLTVVEAMLVGVPPVVPPLGAIPDVVVDEENGLLVAERTPGAFADALERLVTDDALCERLAANAPAVESTVSMEAVADSWAEILASVTPPDRAAGREEPTPTEAD
jgi:glycosyltransferase involved in cell wall biosynthesis